MLRATLFSLLASVLAPTLHAEAVQVQLAPNHHVALQIDANFEHAEWILDRVPDRNATDHLIFETVHSLLQHWPNTRMRNGHSIVPGIIPRGTLLYHGTPYQEISPGPEWAALDPEHAHFFCRKPVLDSLSHVQTGCWQLTVVATRPLKIIYFDRNSAAKLSSGTMDTQDLLLREELLPDIGEEQLIVKLCEWGQKFSVDAFVRMEMAFEVMLCDFVVSVVSFANLVVPYDAGGARGTSSLAAFENAYAGTWHDRFPGETRIQLDLAGLVSLYDTRLAPSLVSILADQERWDHRVQNLSETDLLATKPRTHAVLTRPVGRSSGINWRTLIQVVVDRFTERLELTRHLLSFLATNPDDILGLANKTQTQLRVMLTPCILFSAVPTDPPDKTDLGN